MLSLNIPRIERGEFNSLHNIVLDAIAALAADREMQALRRAFEPFREQRRKVRHPSPARAS